MLFFEVYPRVKVRVTEQEDYVYPENDSGILAFLKLIESLHFEGNLSTWIFWFGLAIISIFLGQDPLHLFIDTLIISVLSYNGTFYFFCEIERISTLIFAFAIFFFVLKRRMRVKSTIKFQKHKGLITRRFTPSTKGWILHLMSI